MKTEVQPNGIDAERIEQLATLALIIGVLAVFQSSFVWLYWVGLVLLALGTIGTLAARVITQSPVPRIIERMVVIGMMVGILGMLQSWHIWLYENGFYVLALSTLTFIIVSHIGSPEAQ